MAPTSDGKSHMLIRPPPNAVGVVLLAVPRPLPALPLDPIAPPTALATAASSQLSPFPRPIPASPPSRAVPQLPSPVKHGGRNTARKV